MRLLARQLWRRLAKSALRLAANSCGSLAINFSLAAPLLIGTSGLAVDYVMHNKVKADLQAAADAAAVAAAREIQLAQSDTKQVTSAAVTFAAYKLTGKSDATTKDLASDKLQINATVLSSSSSVKVDISEAWTPFFAHFIDAGITPVTATATARYVGSSNICVLGLGDKPKTIYLDKNSRLTGNNCGVFSNSTDGQGLLIDSGAIVSSSLNCVVGGADVSSSSTVSPKPLTDCPPIPDPLAARPAPAVGGCDHTALLVNNEIKTLDPGVYCNGLTITGTSQVTLNPGTYVINGGQLVVSGQARVAGDGVSFFLTGTSLAAFNFTQKTHVSLSAPTSGALAGLLFYEDRSTPTELKHKISSDDARKLIGTIYLPAGDLVIDAKNPVADQSAYTAIVVKKLELNMGPNLVLNSDYSATSVPVPEGIRGTSQVVLTQ